jgi:hypothetical protein
MPYATQEREIEQSGTEGRERGKVRSRKRRRNNNSSMVEEHKVLNRLFLFDFIGWVGLA